MIDIKYTIKKKINQVLAEEYKLVDIKFQIEYPPKNEFGDYSSNVAMVVAKKIGRNPIEIGDTIAKSFSQEEMFTKINIVQPGFINFYLDHEWLGNRLKQILQLGNKYGSSQEGKGKKIIIDYSAPNIAKKMHVGHLRSTVIGAAIYNIYNFLGYKVVRDNHLGDWGTQFGKLIYEYKQKYGETIKTDITVEDMEGMYLDFHKKAKDNPVLEEEARKELKKLQDKNKFNYRLWKLFYKTSLDEFKRVYRLLDVEFDTWHGESFYNKMLPQVIKDAQNKKVAKRSKGALIIELDKYNLPPFLIQKTDGAFLYGTTDLATIKYRHKKYSPDKNIYVVANQQAMHFEQLFKSSELLSYHDKEELIHVKFGLILGKGGKKMSTRDGGVVNLVSIIHEGIEKAKKRVLEKNKHLNDEEAIKIANTLALGSIKYNDLSQNRLTDIIFDWDKMLNFSSNSSPYLQYTYVRIASMLKKIKINSKKINYALLKEKAELNILKDLVKFPEIIKSAAKEYKPNLIALYLEQLASDFHYFYEQISIIKSKGELQKVRLALVRGVAIVIENGLKLLGIDTPEKM